MELYPESLDRLIGELAKLPTIGRKSAERLAMSILNKDRQDAQNLSQAIIDVKDRVRPCKICGNFTEEDICQICSSPRRTRSVITVVEDATNLIAIEKSREYTGLYHVLGGLISPLSDISADNINIDSLIQRAKDPEVEEVILAISPTVEGETTALFLKELLKDSGVRVTKIASGIPMGGSLQYFDSEILTRALEERREI